MEQEIEQKITRFLSEKTEIPAEELDLNDIYTIRDLTEKVTKKCHERA